MRQHGGDREAKTQMVAGLATAERTENFSQFLGSDLRAGVAHQDVHSAFLRWGDHTWTTHTHHGPAVALTGGFGGILEQFGQQFLQLGRIHIHGGQTWLNVELEGNASLYEGFADGCVHHADVVTHIQGLQRDLGAAARRAYALAEARGIHRGLANVLHVFEHGRVRVLVHQNEAAKALDDGEEVVQLVRETAQEFLMETVARFGGEVEVGREGELHGAEGGSSVLALRTTFMIIKHC